MPAVTDPWYNMVIATVTVALIEITKKCEETAFYEEREDPLCEKLERLKKALEILEGD